MRGPALATLLLLSGVASAAAEPPRVRALDGIARQAFEDGFRRSASFRTLVAELNASDVIVHVVTTIGGTDSPGGETRFAVGRDGTRYVRIQLNASLPPKLRIALLAHELQHACELARSAAATADEYRALYEEIGTTAPGTTDRFDTPEAEEVGLRVWLELGERATGAGPFAR